MKLFDLHCDTLTECEKSGQSIRSNNLHWDFDRASTLFASSFQITAVYSPDGQTDEDAWKYFQRILSFMNTQSLPVVRTATDLSQFRHGVLLAVENGNVIGHDLSKIKMLASLGCVYVTLTWNGSNAIGNGCLSGKVEGLSAFGRQAVADMLRVGILPDTSHLNRAGFWDVVELSGGHPLLASHSDSDAVHAHPRNLTDEQFAAICQSGGLVGLNLCKDHLGTHSFEQIERHFAHYLDMDGESGVALGMDLDGMTLPEEWHGIEVAKRLYDYLLSRRYPQDLIDGLFFKNSYAFFTKALTRREKCIRIGS